MSSSFPVNLLLSQGRVLKGNMEQPLQINFLSNQFIVGIHRPHGQKGIVYIYIKVQEVISLLRLFPPSKRPSSLFHTVVKLNMTDWHRIQGVVHSEGLV